MSEGTERQPLGSVHGAPPRLALFVFRWLWLPAIVCWGATAALAKSGIAPWTLGPFHLVAWPRAILVFMPYLTGLSLFPIDLALRGFLRRRCGSAWFTDDRILIEKPATQELRLRGRLGRKSRDVVRWLDLRGYDDGSSDFVQLLRIGKRVSSSYDTIPTPTEKDRTEVLRVLDQCGVRRLD